MTLFLSLQLELQKYIIAKTRSIGMLQMMLFSLSDCKDMMCLVCSVLASIHSTHYATLNIKQ